MAISLLNEVSAGRPWEVQRKAQVDQLTDELEKKAPFDEDSPRIGRTRTDHPLLRPDSSSSKTLPKNCLH